MTPDDTAAPRPTFGAGLLPACPQCGRDLSPVALGPETAPWLCGPCRLGFWQAELTAAARAAWHPGAQGFGWEYQATLSPARVAEAAAAAARGTSARPDQLGALDVAALKALAVAAHLDPGFVRQIAAILAARGVK